MKKWTFPDGVTSSQKLSSFVDTLERQYGLANSSFTEHAILRLSTTIRSLLSIEEALISCDDSSDELQAVAESTDIEEALISCDDSSDELQAVAGSTEYRGSLNFDFL